MRRVAVLFVIAIFAICPSVYASTTSTAIVGSDTFMYTGVDSIDGLGDLTPGNVIMSETIAGGYMANEVVVTGTLTEIDTGTFASEADIEIITPGGSVIANGSTTGGYTGTIATGPTVTSIGTPFDPAGASTLEFFESFDDTADGVDQVWDDVTIEIREASTTITDGMFALGTLPDDGTMVFGPGQAPNAWHTGVLGGLDFFTFDIGAVGAPGSYLNIQTIDALTGDTIDTEIALYDALGNLVASDDDGQETALGGLYSMLSFGVDDPLAPGGFDANSGDDGATLPAGSYTLALGPFDATFGPTLMDVTPGTSTASSRAGDYDIKFTYAVPEPAAFGMLLLGALGLLVNRRR